jgi:hypothetical protein
MKRIALLTVFAIASVGCGSTTVNDDKPEAAANKSANVAANPTLAANTNVPNTTSVQAVKVTVPSDHKFGGEGLPKGWKWIDPDTTAGVIKYDTSGGTLKFTVPTGKDMFGDNRTAPQMLQSIEGNFQIETRVKFDPRKDYQGAGLFI